MIGHQAEPNVTPDAVVAELKIGNAHHVRHQYQHPHETRARQRELVAGQHPHAEILSCADSRVPPEIIFDQGLGDLFTVRVAGNVATDVEIGSLEYGAEHLHIPLLVVLGHESCGAVTAAVQGGAAKVISPRSLVSSSPQSIVAAECPVIRLRMPSVATSGWWYNNYARRLQSFPSSSLTAN